MEAYALEICPIYWNRSHKEIFNYLGLCRFHFSPIQISFITREMQKEREKPPQPEAALPLNNLNKMNRNNRSSHPYLSNSSRRSPVRGTVQDLTDSTGASETEVIFLSAELLFCDSFFSSLF